MSSSLLGTNLHNRFVINTSPKICVHWETMLPTTCPHLLPGSIAANAMIQPIPVITRNMVSECSRKISITAEGRMPFGCLLSAEPFSYRNLVITMVTKFPSSRRLHFQRTIRYACPGWSGDREESTEPRLPARQYLGSVCAKKICAFGLGSCNYFI